MSRSTMTVAVAAAATLAWVLGPAIGQLSTGFLGVEYTDHYGTQWFYWYISHGSSSRQDEISRQNA